MPEFTDEELFFGGPQNQDAPHKEKVDPYTVIRTTLSDVERRLRVIEERYSNLRKKTQITDQNMLEQEAHANRELKSVTATTNSLKFQLQEISEKISLFNSEFGSLAKKQDLRVIEKYLDMWQPMNFITRAELEKTLGKP